MKGAKGKKLNKSLKILREYSLLFDLSPNEITDPSVCRLHFELARRRPRPKSEAPEQAARHRRHQDNI